MSSDAPVGTPLTVFMADDEAPARRRLRRLLDAIEGVQVVGEATSGVEAVAQLGELADAGRRPDLVLLDIQMPQLDGFGVVAQVGVEQMPPLVFVTAYDEHALRAFEVRALDYVVKPVEEERLREAIARARARRDASAAARPGDSPNDGVGPEPVRDEHARALAALLAERGAGHLHHILAHDAHGPRLVAAEDITLARADRNYVALHTAAGVYRVRGTVDALAARLDPARFLRANRSDVVRLAAIRELQPWAHGEFRIVLQDGTALLWNRRHRALTREAFELG